MIRWRGCAVYICENIFMHAHPLQRRGYCVIIYRSYRGLPAMVVSSLIVMLIRFLCDSLQMESSKDRRVETRKEGVFYKMR